MKAIFNHKSIRNFTADKISDSDMAKMLEAATRASTIGNMQLYSIIVSQSDEVKAELLPCHFGQAMTTQAAAVFTFCADINRFEQWCKQRDAKPSYGNFIWYVNGAIDALLASQNLSLEAQHLGYGICYLGTTLYTADKIIDVLNLPKGVIPITTVVVGRPVADAPLTDRLPLEAVVHNERYQDYTPERIDALYSEKESLESTKQLLKENQLDNLAKIFTERRYKKDDNIAFSAKYFDVLKKQGFID